MNIDKAKLLEWLNDEISSCEIVNNESDKSIAWACKRVIKRINVGTFDVVPMEHERAYWAREGLIKRQQEQFNQAIEVIKCYTDDYTICPNCGQVKTDDGEEARNFLSSLGEHHG